MGPCAGGAVYSPAMTDFILMVESTSYMFITGPDVIKTVTHEEVTKEELGGAHTHAARSGVAHFAVADERACLDAHPRAARRTCRRTTPRIRRRVATQDPADREEPALDTLVPADSNKPYDIKQVITARRRRRAASSRSSPSYAHEHRGRLRAHRGAHRSASSPTSRRTWPAASTSTRRSRRARFVRFCDCFNIPLVTFVDVPGFLPGTEQEYGGIIKHGAKLLYAFAEATVPKVTVITRKAYGGAYDVMASKHIRADINFAYPTAEIAVMGPDGAVNIVYRNELEKAAGPGRGQGARYVAEYREKFANPYKAAALGYIDEVIRPRETRAKLAARAAHAAQQAPVEPAEKARQPPALTSRCRNRRSGDILRAAT